MKNLIFLLIFFTNSLSMFAQNCKLENLELVSYDAEPNKNVKIYFYSRINKNGKLDVYIEENRGKTYYSYQLNEDEIENINKLCKRNLSDFISTRELEPNKFYAGSRNYISFSRKGKKYSLSYIVPFMNQEFIEVSNLLVDKVYSRKESAKIEEFNIDFKELEKNILRQNQIDNYLPQKTLPPPMMLK